MIPNQPNQLSLKHISKELFSLSAPMAFTQLITVGCGFLSMAMLGHLGTNVLAASALIFSTRISILIIGSSLLFALSILIGHSFGERSYIRIGNFVQQGWTFAILLSIPIMILFWNMDAILLHLNQSKSLTEIVKQFFHANVFNVMPFLLCISNQQLFYGTRKQKIDFLANLLGVCVLLMSAYLLIFGKLGFPKLEVAGLGYALDLQGWFYFLFTTMIIYRSHFFKPFELFKFRVHKSWNDFVMMLSVGWPICIQISGEMLSFIASATMVGWLGTHSLAAYQVVTQYLFLVVVPLFTLAQATGVLIGQARGEKNYLKIKSFGQAGLLFTLLLSIIVGLIFILIPTYLASLYLNIHNPQNSDTLHLIVILFTIITVLQIFDGVRNTLTGSLRGLFDTKFPMYIGLGVIWIIGLPLGYLLAFNFQMGVAGIAIGPTVGALIGMLMLLYRWHSITNKL